MSNAALNAVNRAIVFSALFSIVFAVPLIAKILFNIGILERPMKSFLYNIGLEKNGDMSRLAIMVLGGLVILISLVVVRKMYLSKPA